jgi:predicted RNA-binding Zn-ribbon protein involved in translation (DUF1610 family)
MSTAKATQSVVTPMPIPIKCPTCGMVGRVADDVAGRQVRCPKCQAILQLPTPGFEPARSAPISSPPPFRKSSAGSKRPNPESAEAARRNPPADKSTPSEPTHTACPFCGEQILVIAKKCKHCGEVLDPVLRASRERSPAPRYDENHDNDDEREVKQGTDAPGVISLIFGALAVVCMLMGCFTCGMTYFAAAPFAAVGAGLAFFGRGNMKIAALVLNFVALIPAVIVFILFAMGLLIGPDRQNRLDLNPSMPTRQYVPIRKV